MKKERIQYHQQCSLLPALSIRSSPEKFAHLVSAVPVQILPDSSLPEIKENSRSVRHLRKFQPKLPTSLRSTDNVPTDEIGSPKSSYGADNAYEANDAALETRVGNSHQHDRPTTDRLLTSNIDVEEHRIDRPKEIVFKNSSSLKFFKQHELADPLLAGKQQKRTLKWIEERRQPIAHAGTDRQHQRSHSCLPMEWDGSSNIAMENHFGEAYGTQGKKSGRNSALELFNSHPPTSIHHSIQALRRVAENMPIKLKIPVLPTMTALMDERVVAERLFKGLPAWDSALLSCHGGFKHEEQKASKIASPDFTEDQVRTTQLATAAMIKAHAASLDRKATASIEGSVTEFCEHGDARLNDVRNISKGSIQRFDLRLGGLRKLIGDFGIIEEKNNSVQSSASRLGHEMQRIEAFLNSGLGERIRQVLNMPELQRLMELNLIPYESNKRRAILQELYKDVAILRKELTMRSEALAQKFAKLSEEVAEREERLSTLLKEGEPHVPPSEPRAREIRLLKESIANAYIGFERDPKIKLLEDLTSRLLELFVEIETIATNEEEFARRALREHEAGAQHRAELYKQQALQDMKKKLSWLVEENPMQIAETAMHKLHLILDRILKEPDLPEHRKLSTQSRISLIPKILEAKFGEDVLYSIGFFFYPSKGSWILPSETSLHHLQAGVTYIQAELDSLASKDETAANKKGKKRVILSVAGLHKTGSMFLIKESEDKGSPLETTAESIEASIEGTESVPDEDNQWLDDQELQLYHLSLEELYERIANKDVGLLKADTLRAELHSIKNKLPMEVEEKVTTAFASLPSDKAGLFISMLENLIERFENLNLVDIVLSKEQEDRMKLLLSRWRDERVYESMRSWRYFAQKMHEERDGILHTYQNLCDRLNIPGLAVMPITQALHAHKQSDFDISGKGISNLGMKALLCAIYGREPDFRKTMSDSSTRDADRLATISIQDLFAFKLEHSDLFHMRDVMSFAPLKRIILKDNDLKASGAQALAQVFMGCTVDLDELDLESNNIGEHGGLAIAALLNHVPARPIRCLNLSRNKLGDAGAAAVLQALADSAQRRQATSPAEYLLHIDISRNEAAGLTAQQAANVFSEPRIRLKTLNLGWNLIRQEAATILFEGLRGNKTLKYLNMEWNGLGSTHCCFQIGEALGTCALHTLNLSRCRITAAGTSLISNGLLKNKELELLVMDGNSIMQTGARVLFKAKVECTREAGAPQLTISTSDCNIEVKDASCFDISEPAGAYSLDMKMMHNRQVLLELMRLVSSGKGRFMNFPEPVIDENYSNVFNPYVLSVDSKVEEDWWIPEAGILRFTFANSRVAATHDHSLATSDREWAALGDEIFDPETSSKQWISIIRAQISGNTFLRFEQVAALLTRIEQNNGVRGIDRIALSGVKVEIVKHSYTRLIDPERNDELLGFLDPLERSTVEKYLGPTAMNYTQNNPTGFYILNLATKSEREVFVRLIELYNAQINFWNSKTAWYSLRAGGARPEVNLCWRQAKYEGLPHEFSNSWPIPHSGIYQLQFVQITKPSPQSSPASEHEIQELISSIEQQDMESENLVIIRRWSNSHLFLCEHLDRLLTRFKEQANRVELCVIAFARTLDWHGYVNVLALLNPAEYKLLRHRLGMLNLFDDISAVGFYELELTIPEDRFVSQELVHLAIEEPGDNIIDCQYNGVDMTITGGWAKSMPVKGLLSFYYCRELECIRRVAENGCWSRDGYPHPECIDGYVPIKHRSKYKPGIIAIFCEGSMIQPAGRLWVRDHKLRSIIFKMKSIAPTAEEMFKMLDRDGGGSIDSRELAAGLFRIGVWLQPLELKALVQVLDADGGGTISVDELKLVWDSLEM